MGIYQLAPPPSLALPEISFATWTNGFSEEEINKIISIGDSLTIDKATVNGGENIDKIRSSKTGWIDVTPESSFIYDNLGYIARQLNGQFFDLDIWGFVEHLQYTIYDGNEDHHYTWHLDRGGSSTTAPRKLSLVLQLSDPSEYEGGDLEIFDSHTPIKVEKQKGLVVAFPSFVLHRVTPVTKGIRKTLVVWLTGPRFK